MAPAGGCNADWGPGQGDLPTRWYEGVLAKRRLAPDSSSWPVLLPCTTRLIASGAVVRGETDPAYPRTRTPASNRQILVLTTKILAFRAPALDIGTRRGFQQNLNDFNQRAGRCA